MTKYEKLMIIAQSATIIAIIISPVVAIFMAARINHPKPNPEANQPANRSQSIGGRLQRFLTSKRFRRVASVLWYIAIVANVAFLIVFWFNPTLPSPINARSVMSIAFDVGLLFFQIIMTLFYRPIDH